MLGSTIPAETTPGPAVVTVMNGLHNDTARPPIDGIRKRNDLPAEFSPIRLQLLR
jgi:hypothetical protein